MRRTTWIVVGLLAASLVRSAPLAAQNVGGATGPTNERGFFLGAALNGTGLAGKDLTDNEAESGGGLSLSLGYQFHPNWAFFVEGAGANMSSKTGGDQYILSHFDLGVRYHFVSATRSWVPYLDVAFSGRAASEDNIEFFDSAGRPTTGTLEISGTGFSFGGGFNFHTSPRFAIQTGLRWTVGDFTTVKFRDISVSGLNAHATTGRFNLGVVWYPGQGPK